MGIGGFAVVEVENAFKSEYQQAAAAAAAAPR
jgi:hypothetical protein